jgi:hypothetical protein
MATGTRRFDLTGFQAATMRRPGNELERTTEPANAHSVAALLAEAGLELWQAPEGFWAIRVRPSVSASPPRRPRHR